jgi:hypothetical protein
VLLGFNSNIRTLMKKLVIIAFFALIAAVVGANCNSCAPTSPNEVDTTKLISAPSSATLTRSDSTASFSVSLTCGCNFGPLIVTGYGDTSKIHFRFNEPLTDATINIHTIIASIFPTSITGSGSDTSWIALYYLHNSTYHLYDTIRVIANY